VIDLQTAAGSSSAVAPTSSSDVRRSVIVLDPGHGGSETGALGPSGAREKELTLLLAQTLARRLEERLGVKVVLTRDDDADLGLDARSAIANQHGAELFVSLHLNASFGAKATGAETYFLSLEASDARAAAAAAVENQPQAAAGGDPVTPDGIDEDLRLILWDLAQTHHLGESQRFARLVQQELDEALGLRDRGVKQAPFRVLMGAAMPAVLVELGFITNPAEEQRLLDPEYRGQLVEALVRAIQRFRSADSQPPLGPSVP
jgi:N-acetylmuramoyl-L-alanine amidase